MVTFVLKGLMPIEKLQITENEIPTASCLYVDLDSLHNRMQRLPQGIKIILYLLFKGVYLQCASHLNATVCLRKA